MAISTYFNAAYYLQQNPDVMAAGNTADFAWAHYMNHGAAEALTGANAARKPAPWFDIQYYVNSYPDLVTAGLSPVQMFEHFTTYGISEGRSPANGIVLTAANLGTYAAENPDLQTAFGITDPANLTAQQQLDLANHFYTYGYKEDRPGEPANVDTTPGQTFTLTNTVDNVVGTAGDDTIVGVLDGTTATNTTLSAADQIDGRAGTDTFSITLQGGATANVPAASVKNVEIIDVRNVSAAATIVNGAAFIGAEEFVNNRSSQTVEFTNIGTADLTIKGDGVTTNAATDFTSSATASVTDELVINIQGGVTAGAITNQTTAAVADTNGDWTSVVINASGGTATATTAANTVGALGLSGGATMRSLTINASTSLTTGAITGWDTTGATTANKGLITISGAGAVNVGALNAAVEDVVATANTGGVTLTASTQTDFTFAGGSGNDRVTTNAVLSTGGSINAGAGTADRLIVGNNGDVVAANGALYAGFEQLQVSNGITVDMDDLSANNSIDTIRLTTGGVVNDMTAAQAANVIVTTGGNSPTLGVKGATTVGQIDTVHVTADDGVSTTSTIALGTPVLAGIEILKLTATDNITVTALTSATALSSVVLDGAGTISLTSGAITPVVNTVIDGSAATGALTIDYSGVVGAITTSAISFKGGSGNDTITTTGGAADLVNGGLGIDSITVTKDVASSGFATVQSDAIATVDSDLITGFLTTENKFDFNGVLSNGTGSGPGISATEIASAANIAAALATGDAANDIVFIATTALTGAQETAIDAAVAGGMTGAEASAIVTALLGTGGALNGAIANLDSILGVEDSVLFQFSTDTDTVTLRITNTDQSTVNTLTADEVQLVGVFGGTADRKSVV